MPTSDDRNDLVFHPDLASVAAGTIPCSPVIIPGELALEFLTMCQRNPKSCPVIPVSNKGAPSLLTLGADIDDRRLLNLARR
jgi:uncharacterized protein YcsI (UPF0317 family)